jgi:DUF4097 and DUF4098 domain-containing protein YvlB
MSNGAAVPYRRSFAGPIVLIALGVIFLLGNMGVLTWHSLGLFFARYWPLFIILWGVVKLIEYYQAQREGVRARGIGVGGFFLLFFIVICGLAASQSTKVNWNEIGDPIQIGDDFPLLGNSYDFTDQLQQAFPAGASLKVASDRGNVTVSAWDQNSIKIAVHKKVVTNDEQDSKRIDQATKPTITVADNVVTVNANTTAAGQHGVSTDLEILIPKKASVDLSTRRGEVAVRDRVGAVKVSTAHGDVTLEDVDGNADVTIRSGSLRANRIKGDLLLDGRLDDSNISDVTGSVKMTGDFFGSTTLAKISKGASFKSSRTDMDMAGLPGEMTLDSGDLHGTNVTGPFRLSTRSKDIHLENISGDVRVENSNGTVEIHPNPLGNIQVDNRKGDVQLVLPSGASFNINAHARRGEVESDFSQLTVDNSRNEGKVSGTVGKGGPNVEINNEHGTIEIRKG